ncbi:hypothetical protein V1264_013492 [Littorina saxatilis]|uniref:Uncharacterized protein n=2 Tax=Littorina saxatilis TaxID=31220 RepID=A0AAN9BPS9_9CAEN
MGWYGRVIFILSALFGAQGAGRFGRDLGDLVQDYDYNRVLLENIPSPHYVVFPTQLRNKVTYPISTKEHKIRHHGTHEHMKNVVIQMKLNENKIRIKLERNDALLSSGIMVKHFTESNQQVIQKTVEHCYYHGHVKKDEWSSVAVSTCHGIRGVIQMHNETFIIQPLIGGGEGFDHPHVLYKATVSEKEKCGNSAGLWLPFHELHKGEFIKRLKFLKAQRDDLGIDRNQPQILRLGLVLDKFMYMGLNFSQQLVTRYALEIANVVNMYYLDLGFHVSLTYLEYWDIADRFIVSAQQRELLQKFQTYKMSSLPSDQFDVVYFLTGITLASDSVGMAIPDSVCSQRALGIVKSGKPFEPQQTAANLAHMIGHSLGINHDEDAHWRTLYHEGGCKCSDDYGCIMSVNVLAHNGFHSRMFSTCSESDLDVSLSMGITSCLQGAPSDSATFTQTCGNSIVERGEECDCGSEEDCESVDPCCDPHTCLLRYWAQCRSGPCCTNCTVLDSTHMCRDRQSECDIPEFCDGDSGNCPFNTYIEDGHPCASGAGYCMGGICPTLDTQCANIWGNDADGGNKECYQRFNPTGNFQGHCGREKDTWNYARCQQQDILCGLLHCSGGNAEPLFHGADKGFSKTTINDKDTMFECKSVHGPAMMDIPHMGLVQDGTRCRADHVCRKNRCVPLPFVPVLSCPGTDGDVICSGHGVCTPDDACFCNNGWMGDDCSEPKNVTTPAPLPLPASPGSPTPLVKVVPLPAGEEGEGKTTPIMKDVDSTPVTAENPGFSTTLLIIILATVVGGLVLVLGITLICYRRRSPLKLAISMRDKDPNNSKKDKKRFGKKKWLSSEDESELGELPPPPVIISDPNSMMPEKGILKNSCPKLDGKRGSDSGGSQQRGSESGGSYVDQDSVGTYNYDDDDDLEIREIFRDKAVNSSMDNLDNMPESASFDFVIPPPPPPQYFMQGIFPSPPSSRQYGMYDETPDADSQPLMWRTPLPPQTLSPPQSRIVRLRNFNDLMARFDKTMVDLSPSPDEPPVQLSPSTCTSEDVRSSETEPDRMYYRASHSDHSPTSVASSCTTQHTYNSNRPTKGNFNQYLLKTNNLSAPPLAEGGGEGMMEEGLDEVRPHPVHMPPPMHPINIRNFMGIGARNGGNHSTSGTAGSTTNNVGSANNTLGSRDSNETPQGSQGGGDASSLNGTPRHGAYEKSSGYGSEHDLAERLSVEDNSLHSRSQSTSPPPPSSSYSAVIRTGPNRIQLVTPGRLLNNCGGSGSQEELQRLLEGLPRIDAGSYERSPIVSATVTPSTPNTGPIPPTKLSKDSGDDTANLPCIDRSLEEIPQVFIADEEKKSRHSKRLSAAGKKSKRPISLCVGNTKGNNSAESQSSSRETVQELCAKKQSSVES